MRAVLASVLIVLLSGVPAAAEDVIGVIKAQVAAFQRDDAPAAFGHASPMIQAKFGDAYTFLSSVRKHYRPVYRPRKTTFLKRNGEAVGPLVQRALVEGPDGQVLLALYSMVRIDGRWRIDGCILAAAPGTGT